MDILEFITQEGLVMIPVLMILGFIVKNIGSIKNEFIPVILLITSVAITPWLLGGFNALNIVQSVLVVGGAVLTNQTYKQIGYIKDGDKSDED